MFCREIKTPQSLAVKGFGYGVPGRIRTCDAGIRSPALYPLSYGDAEMVGAEGFEPPTPCSQSKCATKLRYAPTPKSTS